MQAGPVVGEATCRIDGTNRAMNVQMIRVAMDDHEAPMVAQSKFVENLADVPMRLLVGKQSALAFVPRPDEVHRAGTDAFIPYAVGVDL
jgi:hypothetical protein